MSNYRQVWAVKDWGEDKIVGVFEEADRNDFYWQVKPDAMNIVCLMNENLFYEYFTGDKAGRYTITCNYFQLFEYDTLTFEGIGKLLDQTEWLTSQSKIKSTVKDPVYIDVLKEYQKKRERIDATLFILQVPVLILLAAFLFMISGQMYDMERNEISVMKSRGGSSGQMFRLYLYQSTFLALIGAVGGIPLGAVGLQLGIRYGLVAEVAHRVTLLKRFHKSHLCTLGGSRQ